jgi:beta-glucanase (GH16 family)
LGGKVTQTKGFNGKPQSRSFSPVFNDKVYQTVHSDYTKNNKNKPPKRYCEPKIDRDAWNNYGIEWDENTVTFTVNGKTTHSYPRMPELGENQWSFDTSYYFIFSMQIGGGWVNGSGPSNPEHYPAGMEIDWVRVYKNTSTRVVSSWPGGFPSDHFLILSEFELNYP